MTSFHPVSGTRRSSFVRAVLTAVAVSAMALGGLLLVPSAQAGGGNLPIPREVDLERVLKPVRCAEAAEDAGWRGSELVIATAISLAESGCDPKAVGTNPPTSGCPSGSRDRGAWQINDCYHPTVDDDCAFNLTCNAEAAYDIYQDASNTFEPWTTWDTRAFKFHLNEARRAVKNLTGQNIVVGVVTTTGGDLTIRRRSTSESPAVGSLPHNAVIVVKCQKRGQNVYSPVFGYETRLWDKLAAHEFVSDGYVHTDATGRVAPRC